MDYHQNARLTVHSREQLAKMVVEQGLTKKVAAMAFQSVTTVAVKAALDVGGMSMWMSVCRVPLSGACVGTSCAASGRPNEAKKNTIATGKERPLIERDLCGISVSRMVINAQ
jgi:hypothetical protein